MIRLVEILKDNCSITNSNQKQRFIATGMIKLWVYIEGKVDIHVMYSQF